MNIYLIIILVILVGEYILALITDSLNLKNLKTELPEEFKGYFDEEKYRKSQEYTREYTRFSFIESTLSILVTIAFILLGGFNYVDQFARSFGYGSIVTGLIFIGFLVLATTILGLPFAIYSTFVIEEKYGFNKTTPKTFVLDLIKSLLIGAILGGLILTAILWFFETTGDLAWLYSWFGVLAFTLVVQFLAPVVIMPLFNKFTPLEEGELKDAIYEYAQKEGFKIKGIFTMDGSKRSTKLNAFFTGLGRFRRIVFFDTLVEKLDKDEIITVLGHEMGHYKKKHIVWNILIAVLSTGLLFYILSLFINNRELFDAFKMEELSIYASILFFMFLYSPINTILSILSNMLSRKHEYTADRYAVKSTQNPDAMIRALKKLSVENLSNLTPHPIHVFINYGHPPILQRIQAIRRLSKV